MHDFVEPGRSAPATRRYAGVRYSSQGMAALLLAALLVPAPGNVAIAAIAATGLIVMGAQHVILRRLIARCAERIATQEALLAGAATWRDHPEALFGLADIEARNAGCYGVPDGKAFTLRGRGARAGGRRLAA